MTTIINYNSNGAAYKSANFDDIFVLLQCLQCGKSKFTIVPSIIYLISVSILMYRMITRNVRPQMYRRIERDILLQVPWQEILLLILIYQCARLWMSLLVCVNTIFDYYDARLLRVYPSIIKDITWSQLQSFSLTNFIKDIWKYPFIFLTVCGVPFFHNIVQDQDLDKLDPMVQILLGGDFLKILFCFLFSVLPYFALLKIRDRRPFPHFLMWLGPMRRARSELGSSSYFLERPFTPETATPLDTEDGLRRSNSVNDVTLLESRHLQRLRARKSVSV